MSRIHQRGADGSVADPTAHDHEVRGMFSRISGVYDFMNHAMSFDRDRVWRRNLVRRLDADTGALLDLCAGTGDLALAALRADRVRIAFAADFCVDMMSAGRRKGLIERVPALGADAQRLPLRDACVDAVTVGFGVRNWASLRLGLEECARVLRPGGQLLVLDFFRDDPGASGESRGKPAPLHWWLDRAVPAAGRLLGRDRAAYAYLTESMERFVTPDGFVALLSEMGFADTLVERQTMGIAHLVGGRLA